MSTEKLTDAAVANLADAFAQALRAAAVGDHDGKDAKVAKMRTIVDNPNNRA